MQTKTKTTHNSSVSKKKRTLTPLFSSIDEFAQSHELLPKNATIVVGLSGGPDSVFLLLYLVDKKNQGAVKKIIAAHLDHEWRPDSAEDVAFCASLAEQYNVPFVSKKISELAAFKWDGSKEEIGRKARRTFLESVMREHNANAIALAHHLQDQEETFFIRLLRGSSLTGLCAMWSKNGPYIRPLLETNKDDLVAYLDEQKISYLIDPSNESRAFLRNRIRATVIPALKECDDRFDTSFLNTLNRLQETELFLDQLANTLFAELTETENGHLSLDLDTFLALQPVIQQRLLIKWLTQANVPFPPTQAFLDEIMRFLRQPEGKTHAIHPAWEIVKKKHKAWIVRKNNF